MPMRRIMVAILLMVVVASCDSTTGEARSGSSPSPGDVATQEPAASPSVTFGKGTVIIEGDEGPVLVPVEVAEHPDQRSVGLMYRTSLDPDKGMLFMFFEDTSGGFWMKNTQIPLSIAFFDRRGKIVRILDMEPCREEPCPIYDPGAPYRGALEVNAGAFERWGVSEGDIVRITR